jgi:hypothetical protein
MKKYVWFTRYFVIFHGWSDWKINLTEVEIVSETESAWKIKYRDLFGYSTEWIVKDNTNKLEEIK